MFNWFANLFAAKPARTSPSRAVRSVRARYGAAVTNDDNRRHWASADGLSANSANSAEVRRVLRNRSRHESANNSYCRGIILTLAHDVVLRPPTVKMLARPYVLFKLVVTAGSRPERLLQIGKINLAETADSIEQIMAGIFQPASSLKQAPARRVTSRSHLSYLHLSFLPAWGIGHDGKTTSTGGIGSSCPTIGGSSATSFANRISRVRFQPSQSALSG